MLLYTSLLFSTIVLHAFYEQQPIYHHVFLAVTICSIVRYTTDLAIIRKIDSLVAHIAFIAVCMDWEAAQHRPAVVLFPFGVSVLWIAEHVWPLKAIMLHALLHVVSVLGVHCYIRCTANSPFSPLQDFI